MVKASLFVYLRALVADQSFHLDRTLGLVRHRSEVLRALLRRKSVLRLWRVLLLMKFDIVLTTPEYWHVPCADFAVPGLSTLR